MTSFSCSWMNGAATRSRAATTPVAIDPTTIQPMRPVRDEPELSSARTGPVSSGAGAVAVLVLELDSSRSWRSASTVNCTRGTFRRRRRYASTSDMDRQEEVRFARAGRQGAHPQASSDGGLQAGVGQLRYSRRSSASRSRRSVSDITSATVGQSAGPVAPGTHAEQGSPSRSGHCGGFLAEVVTSPFWHLESATTRDLGPPSWDIRLCGEERPPT